jgi:hypothetical protein
MPLGKHFAAVLLAVSVLSAGCGPKAPATSAGATPGGGGGEEAPDEQPGGPSEAARAGSIQGLLKGLPKDKFPKPGADGLLERNEAKEWMATNLVGQTIEVSLPVERLKLEKAGGGKYNIDLDILINLAGDETKRISEGVKSTKIRVGTVLCEIILHAGPPVWSEVDAATAKKYRELEGKQVTFRAKIDDAEFVEGENDKQLALNVTLSEMTPVFSPAPGLIARRQPVPPDPRRPGGNSEPTNPGPAAGPADDVQAAYAPLLALKKPKPKHTRDIPRATPSADATDVMVDEDKVLPRRRAIVGMVDGKPHGELHAYGPNRRLLMIENYDHGKMHGDKLLFYPSGAQLAYYPMKNGQLEGTSFTWWENGNLADAVSWKNGKLHGANLRFFENGQPTTTATFVDGKAQGIRGFFHTDGKLYAVSRWVNNVQGEVRLLDQQLNWNPNLEIEAQARAKVSFLAKDHWTYSRMSREKSRPYPGPEPVKTGEWISLFNGKDLRGWWRSAPNTRYKDAWVKWEVLDGVLVGTGQRHMGWLITDEQFTNFHLRAEARIDAKGNSGVYFSVPLVERYDYNLDVGYEANISLVDPPKTESSRAFPEPSVRTGGIYPVHRGVTNTDQVHHRANEWFTLEVIVRGQSIVTKVNGKTTGEATIPAKSSRPITPGHIALQVHYTPTKVEFRKVEVMRLAD